MSQATQAATSGEFKCGGDVKFRWMIKGTTRPEIYGWFERDFTVIVGTSGFWRTDDADEAFRRAKANFPHLFSEA